jgi:hypothetical protein
LRLPLYDTNGSIPLFMYTVALLLPILNNLGLTGWGGSVCAELSEATPTTRTTAVQLLTELLGDHAERKLKVSDICKLLLTEEQYTSIGRIYQMDSLGAEAGDFAGMCPKAQKNIIRLGEVLILALCRHLKAGHPDVQGVLEALQQRSKICLEHSTTPGPLEHPVCDAIRDCVFFAVRSGNRAVAVQMLSLIAVCMPDLELSNPDVVMYFSTKVPLKKGDAVRIRQDRTHKVHGTVEQDVVEGEDEVLVRLHGRQTSDMEADLFEQAEAELLVEYTQTFRRDQVEATLDVTVNEKYVSDAKRHAVQLGAGSTPLPPPKRIIMRVSDKALEHLQGFIGSDRCIQIKDASVAHKATAHRIGSLADVFKRYTENALASGVPKDEILRESCFYANFPGNAPEASMFLDCICPTCHECGALTLKGLKAMSAYVRKTFQGVEGLEKVLAYLDKLADEVKEHFDHYYDHAFMHCACATHCMTHGLGEAEGQAFGSICDPTEHSRADHSIPEHLPHVPDDTPDEHWDEECMTCGKGGEVLCCATCEKAVHNRIPTQARKQGCLVGSRKLEDEEMWYVPTQHASHFHLDG